MGEKLPMPEGAILHDLGLHPRAEIRDSETGEVIFPAVKGPLEVIEGGKDDQPEASR